jgi:hypothetical protein
VIVESRKGITSGRISWDAIFVGQQSSFDAILLPTSLDFRLLSTLPPRFNYFGKGAAESGVRAVGTRVRTSQARACG